MHIKNPGILGSNSEVSVGT